MSYGPGLTERSLVTVRLFFLKPYVLLHRLHYLLNKLHSSLVILNVISLMLMHSLSLSLSLSLFLSPRGRRFSHRVNNQLVTHSRV